MVERPRILVVESSKALREVICEILIRARHYPCPAESYEKALLQLVACQPHVAVVAFTLLDRTGADVVKAAQEKGRWLPVVGVTGRKRARESFAAVGVTRFLAKPFTAKELLEAVESALTIDEMH